MWKKNNKQIFVPTITTVTEKEKKIRSRMFIYIKKM